MFLNSPKKRKFLDTEKRKVSEMEIHQVGNGNDNKLEEVYLISKDGAEFKVLKSIALMSETIRNLLEDVDPDAAGVIRVPLPNVTAKVLKKVIEYYRYHQENPPVPQAEDAPRLKPWEIVGWDAEFLQKFDKEDLYALIAGVNYLDMKEFLDLTCKHAANQLKGKTPDQICEYFGVKNDFTPEQLEEVRKENEWLND